MPSCCLAKLSMCLTNADSLDMPTVQPSGLVSLIVRQDKGPLARLEHTVEHAHRHCSLDGVFAALVAALQRAAACTD